LTNRFAKEYVDIASALAPTSTNEPQTETPKDAKLCVGHARERHLGERRCFQGQSLRTIM